MCVCVVEGVDGVTLTIGIGTKGRRGEQRNIDGLPVPHCGWVGIGYVDCWSDQRIRFTPLMPLHFVGREGAGRGSPVVNECMCGDSSPLAPPAEKASSGRGPERQRPISGTGDEMERIGHP